MDYSSVSTGVIWQIIVMRVVAHWYLRHGEREDYRAREINGSKGGREWIASSERPWDTTLTPLGMHQAVAAGRAVSKILEEQGFAPVSDVYSSPLLRCAQTSASAIQGLEIDGLKMKIENALAEICSKNWYKSWAMKLSDSAWGGRVEPNIVRKEANKNAHAASHCLAVSEVDQNLSTHPIPATLIFKRTTTVGRTQKRASLRRLE